MEYRNKKTGAVINVDVKMGGCWEKVVAHITEMKSTEKPKKKGNQKK